MFRVVVRWPRLFRCMELCFPDFPAVLLELLEVFDLDPWLRLADDRLVEPDLDGLDRLTLPLLLPPPLLPPPPPPRRCACAAAAIAGMTGDMHCNATSRWAINRIFFAIVIGFSPWTSAAIYSPGPLRLVPNPGAAGRPALRRLALQWSICGTALHSWAVRLHP